MQRRARISISRLGSLSSLVEGSDASGTLHSPLDGCCCTSASVGPVTGQRGGGRPVSSRHTTTPSSSSHSA
eukprot:10539170-Alexandrium_andersonii.AAC.1